MAKGKCAVCDREKKLMDNGRCKRCFVDVPEGLNDEQARAWREENPIKRGGRKPGRGGGGKSARPAGKAYELVGVTVKANEQERKIRVSFEIDLRIGNVRVETTGTEEK